MNSAFGIDHGAAEVSKMIRVGTAPKAMPKIPGTSKGAHRATAPGGARKMGGGLKANLKPMAQQYKKTVAAGAGAAAVGGGLYANKKVSKSAFDVDHEVSKKKAETVGEHHKKAVGNAAGAAALGGGSLAAMKATNKLTDKGIARTHDAQFVHDPRAKLNFAADAGKSFRGAKKAGVAAAGLGAGSVAFAGNSMRHSYQRDKQRFGKALAMGMPKMAKLTKPMGAKPMGGARKAGVPTANPMLRQVNRLTRPQMTPQGVAPLRSRLTGNAPNQNGLRQRMGQQGANVRNNAPKAGQALRNRLGGNR